MSQLIKDEFTDELSEATDTILAEHIAAYEPWMPHEFVPWDLGKNYAFIGGEEWKPEDVKLDQQSIDATVLLTFHKDQVPSYHRLLTQRAPVTTELFTWINRWTSEAAGHAQPLRDYLVVTRNTDPALLEARRLKAVMAGYIQEEAAGAIGSIDAIALVALLELIGANLAVNTAEHTSDYPLQQILKHIAKDDFSHANSFVKYLKVGLNFNEELATQAILRQAAAASPLGADWGEGFDEPARLSTSLYTLETHQRVIHDFLDLFNLTSAIA